MDWIRIKIESWLRLILPIFGGSALLDMTQLTAEIKRIMLAEMGQVYNNIVASVLEGVNSVMPWLRRMWELIIVFVIMWGLEYLMRWFGWKDGADTMAALKLLMALVIGTVGLILISFVPKTGEVDDKWAKSLIKIARRVTSPIRTIAFFSFFITFLMANSMPVKLTFEEYIGIITFALLTVALGHILNVITNTVYYITYLTALLPFLKIVLLIIIRLTAGHQTEMYVDNVLKGRWESGLYDTANPVREAKVLKNTVLYDCQTNTSANPFPKKNDGFVCEDPIDFVCNPQPDTSKTTPRSYIIFIPGDTLPIDTSDTVQCGKWGFIRSTKWDEKTGLLELDGYIMKQHMSQDWKSGIDPNGYFVPKSGQPYQYPINHMGEVDTKFKYPPGVQEVVYDVRCDETECLRIYHSNGPYDVPTNQEPYVRGYKTGSPLVIGARDSTCLPMTCTVIPSFTEKK